MDYEINPVGETLLVIVDNPEERTESGIILTENMEKQMKVCTVLKTGDGVNKVLYKPGDKVIVHTSAGLSFKKLHFIKQDSIYGLLAEVKGSDNV